MRFILNDQDISTELPSGMTVLDFVRYTQGLKGTKIGCREGDCGACTVLVGELLGGQVRYRTMTSCLMPLANAAGKHIVTIEGINPADGSLTPVQQAMVDESGTQCGFCTVGFVMSLTGFCVSATEASKSATPLPAAAISSIDGNICRCTGYKSIERAALRVSESTLLAGGLGQAIEKQIVPDYFAAVADRLSSMQTQEDGTFNHQLPQMVPILVGGGTDVYVQKPETMAETDARPLLYDDRLRGIRDLGHTIEIGGSATVTDVLESTVMQSIFPDLYNHLKLVSSTPIRNMATLAGNFVNASPIGDMTVWFLALDAEIELSRAIGAGESEARTMPLKNLYRGYKYLAKTPDEIITAVRFRRPGNDTRFNFEKVSKRTYLDIATVNTAIQLRVETAPGRDWVPPVLSDPATEPKPGSNGVQGELEFLITNAHVSAGGVAPVPLYLKETSSFLVGRNVNTETIEKANEIIQLEISPISDVRGSEAYKRLLLRQLFRAHFVELFSIDTSAED
jgi:xanthine dehydrogenase small subunit